MGKKPRIICFYCITYRCKIEQHDIMVRLILKWKCAYGKVVLLQEMETAFVEDEKSTTLRVRLSVLSAEIIR